MTIEDLQLVSSSVKLESDSTDLDEISVDYTVHTDGVKAQLVRWRCACPTNDKMISVAEVTYRVSFAADAASKPILESKILEVTWPYFRQSALTSAITGDWIRYLELPIECPFVQPKPHLNPVILLEPKLSELESHPWKQPWESDYGENVRVSLHISQILLEIQNRKRDWLWSLVKLHAYLALIDKRIGRSSQVFWEDKDNHAIAYLLKEFEFSIEDWKEIEISGRKHLVQLVEEMLRWALAAHLFENADANNSTIPDDFMEEDVESLLSETTNDPLKTLEKEQDLWKTAENLQNFIKMVNNRISEKAEGFAMYNLIKRSVGDLSEILITTTENGHIGVQIVVIGKSIFTFVIEGL